MGFSANAMPIWPITPDWTDGVQETLSWSTEVLQASATAATFHRGLRLGPRRAFSFRLLTGAQEKRIASMLLAGYSGPWLLPIWPDVQLLAAPVAADSITIPCETEGYDFVAGGKALIYTDVRQWQAVEVEAVAIDHLQLAPGVVAAPAGARLYPLRRARLSGDAEETHRTDDVSRRTLSFDIDEPSTWSPLPATSLYLGHPVLEVRPDESTDPTSTLSRMLQSVDYGSARPFVHDLARVALRGQQSHWKLFGRTEHAWFRSLLYTLEGRNTPAWVPSWAADLQAVSNVAANSTALRVEWAGYTLYGLGNSNRRQLRIELHDGAVYYRQVNASVTAGDTELLTLSEPLAATVVPASAIRLISFMALSTLASDDVELQHITDASGVATSTTGWLEVVPDVA